MTIKISPSLLEQFRLVRAGLYNLGTDSLIEYITGEYKPNEATSRGLAYHRMLEEGTEKFWTGERYEVHEKELNRTWTFTKEAVHPIVNVRGLYASMVHEVWGHYVAQVNGITVQMNQRYDGLLGYDIHEFKTSGRSKKYSDYYDSLQWRCYMLALPDVERVHYHHFYLNPTNTWCKPEHYTFQRDETVEAFVMEHLGTLVHWLVQRPELIECLIVKN